VLTAEPFIGDSPFCMYLGDNLLRDGVAGFVDEFRRGSADAMILLQHVPNPSEYGVAELDGDRVVRLVEKPKEPRSDLALVGVYLFTQPVFEAARSLEPSWRGELEITDAIQAMVDGGLRVEPHVVTGSCSTRSTPTSAAPSSTRRSRAASSCRRVRRWSAATSAGPS
jgi:glucose-1-phosphate thymidylyltransferase